MISVSAILYIIALYGIDSHIIQSNLYSRAHFNRTLESSTVFYFVVAYFMARMQTHYNIFTQIST